MGSTHSPVNDFAVIGIYVSDLLAAKDFYINDLGLEDVGEMGPGWMLKLGEISFYLEDGREKNLENINLQNADITICFSAKSVKAAYEEIRKKNIEIVMEYIEYSPEYSVFMISDPDGNIIEIAGNP